MFDYGREVEKCVTNEGKKEKRGKGRGEAKATAKNTTRHNTQQEDNIRILQTNIRTHTYIFYAKELLRT